jgi:hypothetical protein
MMDLYRDAKEFFRELLESALKNVRVKASESTEHYLVNLLAGYAQEGRTQEFTIPFVEQLSKALETGGAERANRMRCLGDDALFVSGFLQDSCGRRGITTTYVISVGSRAYGEAGRARFIDHGPSTEVFTELARRFKDYSQVLDEVRELTSMCTDGELVRLYERWTTTQSPEILRRLGRRGLTPVTRTGSSH